MTPEADSAPVTACVLCLRVPPPQQQDGWRDRLAASVRKALAPWRAQPHLVLETPDGFALVAHVAPSSARAVARRVRELQRDVPLAVALHQGPVQASGEGARTRVVGEGLTTAAAMAATADNTIAESEAFRAALQAEPPRQGSRRSVLAAGGIVLLLAAGWGGRLARQRYEALHRPAVLVFDIHPSGEVFIDGEAQGTAPPLDRVPVPPGAHTIEVQHPRAKALHLEVALKPGQEMVIQHVFAVPPVRRPAPAPRRKPGVLDRFRFWDR